MGWDLNGAQGKVEAEFDPEALSLKWHYEGKMPTCELVEGVSEDIMGTTRPASRVAPGPFAKIPDKPGQTYVDPRRFSL